MNPPRPTLHIIPILRWKRGGHQTFRAAQLSLVSIVDRLLSESAANGVLCRGVLLNGQTLILDDYLQLRPEHADDLHAAILDQRIQVGPWYTLPSEFLVQGEALVRNLAAGRRHSSSTSTLNTALLTSTERHVGQLPQILRGFGIESAAINESTQESASHWQAPDGSSVVLATLLQAETTSPQELVAEAQSLLLFGDTVESPLAVLFPISDSGWSQTLLNAISDVQRTTRSMHLTVGGISEHLHNLELLHNGLPTLRGELSLNESPASGLLTSRGWIKQQSHLVETLLLRWAEPFVAWADLLSGIDSHRTPHSSLLNFAWNSVLEIQAPELIGGTHLDESAQEILLTLRGAEEIANVVAQSSLDLIGSKITLTGELVSCATHFAVFNASASQTTDVVTYFGSLPSEMLPIEIVDAEGHLAAFQVEALSDADSTGQLKVEINLIAPSMPPIGYRTYGLRSTTAELPFVLEDNGDSIENEYLNVSISPAEGTLKLFDKRTGRSFNHLNRFVDGGDAGDLNQYIAPSRDTLIDIATNTPFRVTRRIGNAEQRLELFQIYRIPHSLSESRDSRVAFAAQFVPISIWTTIHLKQGVPRVDIDVLVSNAALDHRLRVHFPTGVYANEAFFDRPFEVVKCDLPPESSSASFPQQAFVTVCGESSGFTLANRGLREVEIIATDDGLELAMTLLRCVGKLDDLPTPEAQCLGDFAFAYSLIPHGPDSLPAWHEAWNFQTALVAKTVTSERGSLPASNSLAASDNLNFVLSTVKWAGDRLIIRGYNLDSQPQSVNLELGVEAVRATRTRLDETPTEKPYKVTKQRLSFTAQPHEIVSYLVEMRR